MENSDFSLKGKINLGKPNNEFPRGCFLKIYKTPVKRFFKILFQLQRILAIKVSMKGTQAEKIFQQINVKDFLIHKHLLGLAIGAR